MPLYLRFPRIWSAPGLHVIFLTGLLSLCGRLIDSTNLAGCCWRTRDYEPVRCMEKGPCGGFSAPILPLPTLARPLPSDLSFHGEAHSVVNSGPTDALMLTGEQRDCNVLLTGMAGTTWMLKMEVKMESENENLQFCLFLYVITNSNYNPHLTLSLSGSMNAGCILNASLLLIHLLAGWLKDHGKYETCLSEQTWYTAYCWWTEGIPPLFPLITQFLKSYPTRPSLNKVFDFNLTEYACASFLIAN